MSPRALFAIVQVLGGLAVLGSYAWGLGTQADPQRLWGEIPESWWTAYSLCMPPAALGYLVATWQLWRREVQSDYRRVIGYYAGFLVASTAWMPLCFVALAGRPELALLIQVDLAVAALFALGVGVEIWKADLRTRPVALVAWSFLCWQCVVLDAVIWPRFFVP